MLGNVLFFASIAYGVKALLLTKPETPSQHKPKKIRKKSPGPNDEPVPPPVKEGDTVAIIAPGGPVKEDLLKAGVAQLKKWGLNCIVLPQVLDHSDEPGWDSDYLAGGDGTRLAALVEVFTDDNIKAVICARGGYGTTRLLSQLTWTMIAPKDLLKKRFFGYSDITSLHTLFGARGVVTFHSPMPATPYFKRATTESLDSFHAALFEPDISELPKLQGDELQRGLCVGRVKGPLVGGNLAVLASLCGTEFQPDFDGAILCLEEVGEPPFRIDRMMNQLVQATGGRLFDQIGALVLGDFDKAFRDWNAVESFWLHRVGVPAHVPVLSGVPFGHTEGALTIPMGAQGVLDLDKGTLGLA